MWLMLMLSGNLTKYFHLNLSLVHCFFLSPLIEIRREPSWGPVKSLNGPSVLCPVAVGGIVPIPVSWPAPSVKPGSLFGNYGPVWIAGEEAHPHKNPVVLQSVEVALA